MNPVSKEGDEVLLGLVGPYLAAVVVMERNESEPLEVTVAAIAIDLQVQGLGYGRACMERALDWAADQAEVLGQSALTVYGQTHPENWRSKALLRGVGLACREVEDEIETWAAVLTLN